ncbi:MAG: MarR family transcriptional regulator [Candidatus Limnocylindrales bacterium]
MSENSAAADLAVGRSAIRRRILALLMAEPDLRLHLREIQRRATTSPGTASRELARLVAAGLVEREAEGHQVYFRATSSPFATIVRTLIADPSVPQAGRPTSLTSVSERLAPTNSLRLLRSDRVAFEPVGLPRTIQARGAAQRWPRHPDPMGLKVATRLSEALRPLYAGRLVGTYLYGSRARGEPKPDADVEVLVVLDTIGRYGDELERTSATCASLSLEFGLVVSRVFVSESTWKNKTDGHLLAVRSEVVAV